jgi:uncharacterized protein involved in response to NO
MPSPLEPKGDTSRPDAGTWLSLAASGFRPFFLLAALFAALAVPIWVLILLGKVRPSAYLDAANWHAHEMLFGFVVAVVAGFLLTAVRNWTQRETLTGAPLLALAALWMAGRVAMLCVDRMPRGLPALIDLCFLPLLSLALARPLFLARSYRNFVMLGIVTLWLVANAGMHLDALGVLPSGFARRAALVSVDLAVLMISVVAGRVFPMFTRNATGVASIRSVPAIDGLALGGLTLLVAADLLVPDSSVAALVAGLAGLLAALRAVHWGTRHTLGNPLLWILHAGYAWLPIGLLLRSASGLGAAIAPSLSTHALTVGAVGSLTLGMMARVSLGHTGRPLAAPRGMAPAFAAVSAAAFVRVVVPLFAPDWYLPSLVTASALWSFAFLSFLVVYTPILLRPRSDGRLG